MDGKTLSFKNMIYTKRSIFDVLFDLNEQEEEQSKVSSRNFKDINIILLLSIVALSFCLIYSPPIPYLLFASGTLLLIIRSNKSAKERFKLRELDFYTPIVMERIVMAVEAGHDILPAITIACELGEKCSASSKVMDPVSELLKKIIKLIEHGISLDEALSKASTSSPSRTVRHALLHLALAHKQGGELITPLRELSDATQSQYQEIIEEQIAKLPARATLPLLCTFAGLILMFLAVPVVQVISMTNCVRPL